MSIAKQIQRLNSAKASIKNAIENKGMHVSNNDTLDKYAQYIDNIVGDDIDKSVIFIDDYTQSIYAKYTKEQFLSLTSMPENPTHPNMISQGWNWGLEDAKYYVEKYGRLTIGQIYTTSDGTTKITIDTNVWPDLSPFIIYLYCTKRGDCATIDFGDEIVLGFSYIINGVKLTEPHKDEINDFEEIDKPEEEIWQQPTEIN